MLPTAGFIPPPVVPLVPPAVNGIVATGGLLAGVGAGAAAGAKAGAVLGPKGVLGGALVGGLLLPLLLPGPTAPGTLPGLDPGLNPSASPEPNPWPQPTDEPWLPPGVPDTVGTQYTYTLTYQARKQQSAIVDCSSGAIIQSAGNYNYYSSPTPQEASFQAYGIKFEFLPRNAQQICGPAEPMPTEESFYVHLLQADGTWFKTNVSWTRVRSGTATSQNFSRTEYNYTDLFSLEQSGESIPLDDIYEGAKPKPRPLPVPIKPLPAPEPEPALVPLPEPEPLPEPMVVPSPDNPDAPPITIPQAPPAPPQEVPGPEPEPSPLTVPITPTPIAPPLPVPGVPTIPEPTPDPSVVPAPGPSPDPDPAPGPVPIPQPEPDPLPGVAPSPSPIPVPLPVPGSPEVVPPEAPDGSIPTTPGGSLPPVQLPLPIPTPPNAHFPVPGQPPVTDGGTRPDLSAIAAEVGRIEQKVARIQKNGALGGLADLLWLLPLLAEFLEGEIPGTTYDLQGVCESVEPGQDQPVAEFPVSSGKNLSAIINRLDALPDVLQQHLAYRTPTCRGPKKEGEFRTLSFISDEQSPNGKSRVAKRFRYRSSSGLGLPDIVDHWKDFVWQAGPVCVQHAGATWGTPQVWAATADEGKRVIRHAAREAGFDPDQAGRWIVGGSDSPRYGVPGTMRINTSGGYYMITARDGSDERPRVVVVPPHP